MYTDGEVIFYRPDREKRTARSQPPAGFERAPAQPTRGANLARLEALAERLETALEQVERLIRTTQSPSPGARERSARGGPSGQGHAERQEPDRPVVVHPLTDVAPEGESAVRVSLYAGGGAQAVLGQIRITPADEPETFEGS